VQNILDLAEHGENGKSLPLPGGVEVRRDHRQLIFSLTSPKAAQPHSETSKFFEKKIDFAGSKTQIAVPCLARVFRFTNVDWPAKTGETGNTNSVLDRHTLRAPIVLRSWLPGDRFQPAGHRKAHKLKRLLNQQRISRWDRDGWPVLTSAGVLVWVRGFPVAHGFAASESTKVGLVIAEENIS
jgi:tRNA(Ile)-lysidine synthase